MSNSEAIELLNSIRISGTAREIAKCWLVPRLFRRGKFDFAEAFEKPYLGQVIDRRDFEAAMQLMLRDELDFGVHANRAFLQGADLFLQGRMREAYGKYDEMRQALARGEYTGPHTIGALSIRSLEEFESALDLTVKSASRKIEFKIRQGFESDLPIILVGVDSAYHGRYAERLVTSAQGKVNIHFHICNPGNEALISAPNVRYSFEETDYRWPAYYASSRFLMLRQVMMHYDRPIVTLDADSILDGGTPPVFDLLPNFDLIVGFFEGNRIVMPWRYLSAFAVAVNPTAAAYQVLECFEAQFDLLMAQDHGVSWYVDQALWTSTVLVAAERKFPARILFRPIVELTGAVQRKVRPFGLFPPLVEAGKSPAENRLATDL